MRTPKTNITTEVVTVTHQLADEWLEHRYQNRPLREAKVLQYAEDMEAGRWHLSHQGLAFNEDGQLIDGQHRLKAVTLARVPVDFMVSRGVPTSAILHMDQGAIRSAADNISIIQGTHVNRREVALVTAILKVRPGPKKKPSTEKIMDAMAKLREGLNFMAPVTRSNVRFSSIVGAAFVRAFYFYPDKRSRLAQVLTAYLTGLVTDEKLQIIIRLRDYARSPHGLSEGRIGVPLLFRAEWAIKAAMDGKAVQRLNTYTDETFPLPGEEVVEFTKGKLAREKKATRERVTKASAAALAKRATMDRFAKDTL